jgi:hypothetical protein
MDETFGTILVLVMLGCVLALWGWHFSRSRKMVEQWARDNGLELIEARRQVLFYGPFYWQVGHRSVFLVTVRDGSGQVRHGYVRVGSWFLGLFSDQVNVEWD